MRKLMGFVVILLVLWCGYWFVGARVITTQANRWFDEGAAAQGLTASRSDLRVRGFPNRFDLTLDDPTVMDAARGIGWSGPFAQVFVMTWKPWHVIAALPDSHQLVLNRQTIAITGKRQLASLRVTPSTDVALAEARAEGHALSFTSDLDGTIALDDLLVAVKPVEGGAPLDQRVMAQYQFGLELSGLSPDPRLMARLYDNPDVPDVPGIIDQLRLDVVLGLSAPIDRFAGATKPQLITLDLREARLHWGDLDIVASGQITPDDQGYAAGQIEFVITNWEVLPALFVGFRVIEPQMAQFMVNMLRAVAKDEGDISVLRLPLVLAEGQVSFGPLPLTHAPRLVAPAGG